MLVPTADITELNSYLSEDRLDFLYRMLCFYLGEEFKFTVRNKPNTIGFAVTEMQLLSVKVDGMYVYGYHSAVRSFGFSLVLTAT